MQHSLKKREKEFSEFELDESCLKTRGACRKRGQGAADNQRLQSLPRLPS